MTHSEQQAAEMWRSIIPISGTVEHRMIECVKALEERGYDVSEARRLIPKGWDAYNVRDFRMLQKVIAMMWEALRRAPKMVSDDHLPDTFEELKASWTADAAGPGGVPRLTAYSVDSLNGVFRDKVYGAWYGKCIGCALGDPCAGWPSDKVRKERGRITDYVQKPDPRNDDINYQLLVLHAVDEYGPDFTSRDLAYEWVEHLDVDVTYTAERQALENLHRGIIPPYSARENNPFSHWIGAQMRGEVHGLIAPGRPELAAELAHRDAVISHVTEGVYGEVFNAVMVSLAFVMDDVEAIIGRALGYVPAHSQFASVVRSTVAKCKETGSWERVLDWINDTYGHLHWIHTFPNAAIVVMSLMLGGGDFTESVCMAASSGWDCDCSTGQVGATVGALVGERAIPDRWKEPIADRLYTDVAGFTVIELSKLTDWTCDAARRLARAYDERG